MKRLASSFLFFGVVCAVVLGLFIVQPMPWVSPGSSGIPAGVSPARLEAHVRALSEQFHPRSFNRSENLEAAGKYIEERFAASGGRVVRQPFTADGGEYVNIVAAFGPKDGPVTVVGAHYDSYGDTRRPDPLYTPGADDNASGVAGLLALAELLGKNPPKERVELVAYCLEEPPFFGTEEMGSAAHAETTRMSGQKVKAMISLEMIGYFSDAPGSQAYPAGIMKSVYPDAGNFIAVVGSLQDTGLARTVKAAMTQASDLPVYSINAPTLVPGIDFSDHRNYWGLGCEAVMVTDTAFYRNFAYHTLEDTADRLDYARMAQVVAGVHAAVKDLTEGR